VTAQEAAMSRPPARGCPAQLNLAVPVAPRDTVERLRAEADEVVCLMTPEPFYAVGEHYDDFTQTSDREVTMLLDEAQLWHRENAS
jgi:putative phosphoribosyl transferase